MNILKFIIVFTIAFTSQAWSAGQPKLSDFIMAPAPTLKPIPDMKGAWHWNKPGLQFKDYNKILLGAIEIFIAPDSKYKGIDAEQMKILVDSMRAIMIEALEPDYPVVSKAGPGVMGARIAITNLYLGKPKRKFGQYSPIGLLVSGAKKVTGKSKPKNFSLKEASVEAEMFDSLTGERMAVRLDTKPLRSIDGGSKELSWETIEESLKVYGKRFRERVDQTLGK
jgi:hypothetical protein